MVTKNIKKILLNKDRNKFVADIEDIENRITQNSSNLETAKQELSNKCNEALSEAKAYTDTEKAKYLPLTGGTVTGLLNCTASNATADVNNKELTSYVADITGANAQLSIIKGDGTTSVLSINDVLNATKATSADNATNLGGYPATDYIRSVNGVNASENGNVTIPLPFVRNVNNILPDINGSVTLPLPFVKTVNNTAPDSNGNVVLDLSSSGEGVGLPDLSAGVAISNVNNTYTLPSNGWVIGSLTFSLRNNGPHSLNISIYLNTVLQSSFVLTDVSKTYSFSAPLKSGTQIKLQSEYGGSYTTVSSTLRLYPFLR